jgi:hypothetical protein
MHLNDSVSNSANTCPNDPNPYVLTYADVCSRMRSRTYVPTTLTPMSRSPGSLARSHSLNTSLNTTVFLEHSCVLGLRLESLTTWCLNTQLRAVCVLSLGLSEDRLFEEQFFFPTKNKKNDLEYSVSETVPSPSPPSFTYVPNFHFIRYNKHISTKEIDISSSPDFLTPTNKT